MKTALLTLCALTAGAALAAPRFIGAQEYGVRPGHELIWRVPVHGATTVEAVSLPEGLTFDAARRTLRGRLEKAGDHAVVLRASDGKESVEERLTIRVGEAICLAPPMGWNSWYSYSEAVNQAGMEKIARLLEETGLEAVPRTEGYLTLSTCNNQGGNSRVLVIAVLVEEAHR